MASNHDTATIGILGSGALAIGVAIAVNAALADPLDDAAARALARCESFPTDRGQTAMVFNPRDRQVVWERSECFQDLAALLRDERHCERALERRSWLFDGSGVSPAACRRALEQRRAADRDEATLVRDLHRVVDAAIERNGNGRDLDLRMTTRGSYAHRYRLEASLVGESGSTTLIAIDQPLGTSPASLLHRVSRDRLEAALAALAPDRPLRLRIALRLAATSLDERAIQGLLPPAERESIVERSYVGPR